MSARISVASRTLVKYSSSPSTGASPPYQLPPVDIFPSPARPVHALPAISPTFRISVSPSTDHVCTSSSDTGVNLSPSAAVIPLFERILYNPFLNGPPFIVINTSPFSGKVIVVTAIGTTSNEGASTLKVAPASNVMLATLVCLVPSTENVAPSATVVGRASEKPPLRRATPPCTLNAAVEVSFVANLSAPRPVFVTTPSPPMLAATTPVCPLESRTSPPGPTVMTSVDSTSCWSSQWLLSAVSTRVELLKRAALSGRSYHTRNSFALTSQPSKSAV